MFGKQTDPSRTEDATQKKVNKSRNDGSVPKSQEASKVVSLLAGLVALYFWIGSMGESVMSVYRHFLTRFNEFQPTTETVYSLAVWVAVYMAKIILPILLFLAFASIICMRLQVGSLWTTKVFQPKWSRFNIISSLKRSQQEELLIQTLM